MQAGSKPFADQRIVVEPSKGLEADTVAEALRLGSATLHEAAGRIGALPSPIKPIAPSFKVSGPAFTSGSMTAPR
jgi:4-hydroxy-4-methyl-2-oxoglutarate aldolase